MGRKLLLLLFFVSAIAFSQAPQFLNYQAIARNSSGVIVTNPVGIKFEIIQGSPGGSVVYEETNNSTPSSAGVFTTAIGGGTVVSGTFSGINWANGPYYIRVSIDPSGGTSYSTVGTSLLLSVPYALYAEKSGNTQTVSISGPGVTGSYPNYTITPAGALTPSTGISISSGTITNTAPDQTVTIAGAVGTYPNFTISPAPSTTITSGNSNITVSGTNPFSVSSTPSLSLAGAVLSISNGNSVVLPTGTTYTNGSGIALTSGTIITNTAPDQTVTIGNGTNVNVTGTYPNFIVNSTPTLSIASNTLSISGGNSVTLPASPTYSAGAGISLASGSITNTSPNQTVNVSGPGVSGSYPNYTITSAPSTSVFSGSPNVIVSGAGSAYTISATTPTLQINPPHSTSTLSPNNYSINITPPNIIGAGVTTVNSAGNNYTVNTPPVNMSFIPATGILSFSPALSTNTINITPALSFTNNVLTVGSNTINLPGTGLWSRISTTATALSNAGDYVGIGTNSPNQPLHVLGSTPTYIKVETSGATTPHGIMFKNPSREWDIINYAGGSDRLSFYDATSVQERITIAGPTGNVGIGNNNPGAKLDIAGMTYFRPNTSDQNKLLVQDHLSGSAMRLYTDALIGTPYDLILGTYPNGHINQLFLKQSNGYVGMGTSSPSSKLHVVSNVSDIANFESSSSSDNRILITGSSGLLGTMGYAQFNNSFQLSSYTNIDLVLGTNNLSSINMFLKTNGNVGIGTNAPSSKLHVNGQITMTDGSQGDGKVLVSNTSGTSSWKKGSTYNYFYPSATGMSNVTSTPIMVTSMNYSFNKLESGTTLEIDFIGHLSASGVPGGSGVIFEIRVDGANCTSFSGRSVYWSTDAPNFTNIVTKGIVENLAAGTHSVQIWISTSSGTTTSVFVNPGNWADQIIVKETH